MNMPFCKKCLKDFTLKGFHSLFNKNICLCYECFKDFNPKFIKFKHENISCLAIYEYKDNIKSLLYQLKACYDYELKDIFFTYYKEEIKLIYRDYLLVPIPSSKEDNMERGFNHVQAIFSFFDRKMYDFLYKKYNMKQSKLNKEERKNIVNVFAINDASYIRGKKVVIIDDVYTTGSSLHAAIKLLEKYHPKVIKALFLSKNVKKINKNVDN